MDPNKIKTVQNFQPPQNRKQTQAFLGFINFYRKYIRDLSEMTSKLSNLLRKGTPWKWTDQHQAAFIEIKRAFLEDIIIQYPDFQECFYLSTDASRTAIGAELFQLDKEGKHRTLGFISRTLKDAEKNYHTTELELLAIVFACKKFRNHILGYPIKVLTDHKALTFL
uniref:RNA-directed DNA polymerase n=1 Tax=Schizaphis graminum TaxID=13262 RepID=A0A2S2P0P2_SCHGA